MRLCIECGKEHNTVYMTDSVDVIETLEICWDCIMSHHEIIPITEQITLDC